MAPILSRVSRFAQSVSRTPADTRRLGESRLVLGLKIGVFAALLTLFVGIAGPIVWRESGSWESLRPEVPIERSGWKVRYEASEPCDLRHEEGCRSRANGDEGSSLWLSPANLADPSHDQWLRSARSQGSTYWLGAELGAAELRQALSQQANHLILGYIVARYDVWLDGIWLLSGDFRYHRQPIVVPLPQDRLAGDRPLRIAVRIENSLGYLHPDAMAIHVPEGLFTRDNAEGYLRRNLFEDYIRPAFLAAAFAMLAIVFFWFSLASPRKPETGYLATYVAVQALIQLLAIDWDIFGAQSELALNRLLAGLSVFEGGAAALLGFAFARARRAVFAAAALALLGVLVASQAACPDTVALIGFQAVAQRWLTPLCYLAGGLACLVQALHLGAPAQGRSSLSTRARRLALFGAGLIVTGLCYRAKSDTFLSATQYVYWFRYLNVALALFLSRLVALEYQEYEKLAARTPVSPFHRRPVLPSSVSGVLFAADIRGSEALFRLGARRGQAGELVQRCLTEMWRAAARHGGTVLRTEGDMIVAVLERPAGESSRGEALAAASAAFKAMSQGLGELLDELKASGAVPPEMRGIRFRGAMCEGSVKPVWQEVGGVRHAAWIEAGTTNSLVDLARLLELDRQMAPIELSRVVVPEALVSALEGADAALAQRWLGGEASLRTKGGEDRVVRAFTPDEVPAAPARHLTLVA